jgi:hypothetical protein
MSRDLADLFNKYGTDKDKNGYASLYLTLFDRLKDEKLTILEIGIGTLIQNVPSSMYGYGLSNYLPGGSLRAWRDFFINSRIIGVDTQPDTQFTEDRIETYLCDSKNLDNIKELMNTKIQSLCDIIIDDASHDYISQLQTLQYFFPALKEEGIYIIEDVQDGSPITRDRTLLQQIIGNNPFFFSGYKNNLIIIYKKPLNSITTVS